MDINEIHRKYPETFNTSLNPRFKAYCIANNNNPRQQILNDYEKWPGGMMVGFSLWMKDKWIEFHKDIIPEEGIDFVTAHQEEFDSWLKQQYPLAYEQMDRQL